MFFFRWDDDILHIFFEPDKRTGFKKIISAISNEILDKLSCPRVLLLSHLHEKAGTWSMYRLFSFTVSVELISDIRIRIMKISLVHHVKV